MRSPQSHNGFKIAEAEPRKWGSEADVAELTGRKVKTLQKDRLFRRGFPFYKVMGQVRYDLAEVEAIMRAQRVDCGH